MSHNIKKQKSLYGVLTVSIGLMFSFLSTNISAKKINCLSK